MNILNKHPYLSNFYESKIVFNQTEYNSVNEAYLDYKKSSYPYKDTDTVLMFCTYIKFCDPELKKKLLLTSDEDLDKIKSKKLRGRLKLIKEVVGEG